MFKTMQWGSIMTRLSCSVKISTDAVEAACVYKLLSAAQYPENEWSITKIIFI